MVFKLLVHETLQMEYGLLKSKLNANASKEVQHSSHQSKFVLTIGGTLAQCAKFASKLIEYSRTILVALSDELDICYHDVFLGLRH